MLANFAIDLHQILLSLVFELLCWSFLVWRTLWDNCEVWYVIYSTSTYAYLCVANVRFCNQFQEHKKASVKPNLPLFNIGVESTPMLPTIVLRLLASADLNYRPSRKLDRICCWRHCVM